MTSSFAEFRRHWRPLLAASLGVGTAWSLNSYVLSTLAPYMLAEFRWSRSQWALLGIAQVATLLTMPMAGRLADVFGVRRVAALGAFAYPFTVAAFTLVGGNLHVLLAILLLQTVIGATTTSTVYSRVVADSFSLRRGLALGLFGSSAPLVAALGSPLVSDLAAAHGWRTACLAIAGFSLTCAAAMLLLLPRGGPGRSRAHAIASFGRGGVYHAIFAKRAFWIMLAATFLVNFPFTIAMSQLKIVALDQGVSDGTAALAVSAFAIGAIVGRFVSGIALDVLPTHVVAAVGFALPAAGMLILASSLDAPVAVVGAVLLVGLSFGGEGDVLPFLAIRHFGMPVFSTVMGLLSAAIGLSLACGNGLIGITLAASNSFNSYLLIAAAASLFGSLLFLLLGRNHADQVLVAV